MRRIDFALAGIVLVGGFTTVILSIPRTLSLYYLYKGSQSMSEVYSRNSEIAQDKNSPDPIPCEAALLAGESEQTGLDKAIQFLQKAINYNPDDSRAYLMLGQAYCLSSQYEQAIDALQNYLDLHPKNPYGHLLLGFAYDALCQTGQAKVISDASRLAVYSVCRDKGLQAKISKHLNNAGVTREQLLAIAEQAFLQKQFDIAHRWYSRAFILGGILPQPAQFDWLVSSALSTQQLPEIEVLGESTDYSIIQSDDQINGRDLHWLRLYDPYWREHFGEKLSDYSGTDPEPGFMWWDGSAITFLDVPCDSSYQIVARVKHYDEISPGEIQIQADLNPVANFPLSGEWQEFSAEVPLRKGVHLVGVNYTADVGDAMVDWVRVSQTQPCSIQ